MNNFTFYSPTYFVFGKEEENKAGHYVKRFGGTKVLIHYGGGSVVRSGLLQRVKDSLAAEGIGFVELGGYFLQIDVMDAEVLKAAQENPEAHKTLSVRVSGWNARFVTLNKEWQNMIIERTAQHL